MTIKARNKNKPTFFRWSCCIFASRRRSIRRTKQSFFSIFFLVSFLYYSLTLSPQNSAQDGDQKQRTSVVIIHICPTCSCSGTQNPKSRATHRRSLNATQATRTRAATTIESGRIPAAPSPSSSSSCSRTPASPSHSDPAPLRSKSRPNSSVHGAPRPRRITARANSQLLEHERIEPDAKRSPKGFAYSKRRRKRAASGPARERGEEWPKALLRYL